MLLADTGYHLREEVQAARTLARDVDGFVVLSPPAVEGGHFVVRKARRARW